jgi:3-phosphoshikimate 1-carboxyvinyltransferase
MIINLYPGTAAGTITANASKSAMQRACAAALLRRGTTRIANPGKSNDDLAALGIIKAMGAMVENDALTGDLIVQGVKQPFQQLADGETGEVNCGESGLSIRMFTPIAALANHPVIIRGEGSLCTRPMHFFEEVLPQLNVNVQSNNGVVPLRVQGPLLPKDIVVDGSLSSQFLTGLLMAYAAANATKVCITVNDLKSKPYIDLTLQLMQQFGLKVPANNHYQRFEFGDHASDTSDDAIRYTVEGDWSGAAFLLVAGAISKEVLVKNIFNTSRQADKKIIDALLDAGAEVSVTDDQVMVKRSRLDAFSFDATDCPDLFPPLVALAAHCKGVTTIRGLRRLKHKESDRGATLKEEFDKLGVHISLDDDVMQVFGTSEIRVRNFKLNSHHDHRIAMAVAIASIGADFPVQICNAEAVNKSYPDFWNHLQSLGITLSEEHSVNV